MTVLHPGTMAAGHKKAAKQGKHLQWEQSHGSEAASASTEGEQGWNSKRIRSGGNSPDKELRRFERGYLGLAARLGRIEERLAKETSTTRKEANDKVWLLNENAEKALVMLAACDERFEATDKDLCVIDKQFDIAFDELEILTEKAADAQRLVVRGILVVRWRRRLMRRRLT